MERRKRHDRPSAVAAETTNVDAQKEKEIQRDESPTEWQRCHCELPSCNSCIAEHLAVVHDREGPNGPTLAFRNLMRLNGTVEVNTAEKVASLRKYLSRCIGNSPEESPDYDQKFTVLPSPFSESVFIYWFHHRIADSTIDGRTEFSHASAIVALKFACSFTTDPSELTFHGPSMQVISQVEKSMREGNACYESVYSMQANELGPEETLKICRDLRLKVIYQQTVSGHWMHIMGEYMMNLGMGQVLLIYRYKPYKVLSVACTANPNALFLFDSQLHQGHSHIHSGAMLCGSLKRMDFIMELLAKLQEYLLEFHGMSTFVLLQV